MSTLYPSAIDTNANLDTVVDNTTPVKAEVVNRLRDAIIAVEAELGVKPSTIHTTVRQRLDDIETLLSVISGGGSVSFAGDLSGTIVTQKVIGIQGRPVSAVAPTLNQTLLWNGFDWSPGDISGIFTAAGDLSGTDINQTVIGLQTRSVSAIAPSAGQALIWSGSAWTPSSDFLSQTISATNATIVVTVPGTGILTIGGKILNNPIGAPAVSPALKGVIYFDNTLDRYMVSENAGPYKGIVTIKTSVIPGDGYLVTWVAANNDWERTSTIDPQKSF